MRLSHTSETEGSSAGSSKAETVEPAGASDRKSEVAQAKESVQRPVAEELGPVLRDLQLGQARLVEEFEKFRRQLSQEDEFARFAKQAVQFIDAMDRMMASAKAFPQTDELGRWLQGIESAYHKLLKLLEKYGMAVISCDGQMVDVARHDVVEYRETADYPHDTVIETVLKGIVLRGKALRDARVIVACNRPKGAEAKAEAGESIGT